MMTRATELPATMPRHALVTGAARRIGRVLALRLATMGFDIALHCRDRDGAVIETAAEIEAAGRACIVIEADLLDEWSVKSIVPQAVAARGPLGVLVNNAAIFELDRLDDMTAESWRRHMAINLRAPLLLAQAFVAQLPAGTEALIVNMVDERVVNLTPNYLSYSVAKSGLWAATQVLARALAPQVRVNAIGPGPALPAPGWSHDRFEALLGQMPLRRGTSPDEIAEALALLVRAGSMTGQLLLLDGGQHMGWLTPGGPPAE